MSETTTGQPAEATVEPPAPRTAPSESTTTGRPAGDGEDRAGTGGSVAESAPGAEGDGDGTPRTGQARRRRGSRGGRGRSRPSSTPESSCGGGVRRRRTGRSGDEVRRPAGGPGLHSDRDRTRRARRPRVIGRGVRAGSRPGNGRRLHCTSAGAGPRPPGQAEDRRHPTGAGRRPRDGGRGRVRPGPATPTVGIGSGSRSGGRRGGGGTGGNGGGGGRQGGRERSATGEDGRRTPAANLPMPSSTPAPMTVDGEPGGGRRGRSRTARADGSGAARRSAAT